MSDENAPTQAVENASPLAANPAAPDTSQGQPRSPDLEGQRQYLLQQLLDAPGRRLSQKDANAKISTAPRKELGLTGKVATRLRAELVAQHFIRVIKEHRAIIYELTDPGRQHLETLKPYPLPAAGGRGRVTEVAPEVRDQQKAYLLFQLFKGDGKPVGRKEANRFSNAAGKAMKLNAVAADRLWADMGEERLIEIHTAGRATSYSLMPEGLRLLGQLRQHDALSISRMTGKQLNRLLEAAHGGGQTPADHIARPADAAPHHPASQPADLGRAALAEFEELRREKYGHTGFVPIHEVRARIASKYGPHAARHDALDEPIRQLRRDRRVRLVSLSDLSQATPEQLNDSIPGVNETLFYLEAVHE